MDPTNTILFHRCEVCMGIKANSKVINTSILLVIFLLALGLRLWGIEFGLPYEYHPDEWLYVRQAARMGESGLEPTMWNNPPFFKYILLGEYCALFVIGKFLGLFTSSADFGSKMMADPTLLYLLGRTTSAVIGALTIFLVFILGQAAAGKRVGMLSAFFLAVAFLHVRSSHFAVNDTAITFLVTLAVFAAVQIAKTGHKKWYIVGAVALGVGFSTKYSGLIAVVPLIAAHLLAPKHTTRVESLRNFAIFPFIGAVAAFVASPFFVISPARVIADVNRWLFTPGMEGFSGWLIDSQGGYLFFLKTLVWELGWALTIFIGLGFMLAAISRSKSLLVLVALALPLYLFIGAQKMFFARFILPALPVLLIFAAYALDKVVDYAIASPRSKQLTLMAIGFLMVIMPLRSSIQYDTLICQTDTRTIAKAWVEKNIPDGTKIGLEWPYHTPQLASAEKDSPRSARRYDTYTIGGCGVFEHNLKEYRAMGIEYLIVSSYIYDIPLANPALNGERTVYYAKLNQSLDRVAQFTPFIDDKDNPFIFEEIYGPVLSLWNRTGPGPVITIYRIQ